MFENAYRTASTWTFPVILNTRLRDGRVSTGLGTGFLVNDAGYFLTAAHVVASHPQNLAKIDRDNTRDQESERIRAAGLERAEEQRQLRALGRPSSDDPVNSSLWVLADGIQVESLAIDNYGDIALGKISNYTAPPNQTFPSFARLNGDEVPSGKSLCTLGHAFHQFAAQWDHSSQQFRLPPNAFPIPRFPMDSILTRGVMAKVVDQDNNSEHDRRFIELSSPGLKGQSGGPIFDVSGIVFGLQSQTMSHELGFNTAEKQYIHLGLAVHPSSICEFLDQQSVDYTCKDIANTQE